MGARPYECSVNVARPSAGEKLRGSIAEVILASTVARSNRFRPEPSGNPVLLNLKPRGKRLRENTQRIVHDEQSGLPFVRLPGLSGARGLVHAFLTRRGGVSRGPYGELNLSERVGDDPEAVRRNHELVRRAFGLPPEGPTRLRQVHGVAVRVVRSEKDAADLSGKEGDALVTNRPGLSLAVGAADCAPVILYDEVGGALAVVHAGWKGTALGAPAAALAEMTRLYGTRPANVLAAVGPCAGGCCYEVDESVARAFREGGHFWGKFSLPTGPGKWKLDLAKANALALEGAGVPKERIETSGLCTICREDLFFSYRRDGRRSGRMLSLAYIRTMQ